MVELGGEGQLRCFKRLASARAAAAANDGCIIEGPKSMAEFMYGATGVPAYGEVAGSPAKVWAVISGDRGCINAFSGAYLDEESAKAAAAAGEAGGTGWSFDACEVDLEE